MLCAPQPPFSKHQTNQVDQRQWSFDFAWPLGTSRSTPLPRVLTILTTAAQTSVLWLVSRQRSIVTGMPAQALALCVTKGPHKTLPKGSNSDPQKMLLQVRQLCGSNDCSTRCTGGASSRPSPSREHRRILPQEVAESVTLRQLSAWGEAALVAELEGRIQTQGQYLCAKCLHSIPPPRGTGRGLPLSIGALIWASLKS